MTSFEDQLYIRQDILFVSALKEIPSILFHVHWFLTIFFFFLNTEKSFPFLFNSLMDISLALNVYYVRHYVVSHSLSYLELNTNL